MSSINHQEALAKIRAYFSNASKEQIDKDLHDAGLDYYRKQSFFAIRCSLPLEAAFSDGFVSESFLNLQAYHRALPKGSDVTIWSHKFEFTDQKPEYDVAA